MKVLQRLKDSGQVPNILSWIRLILTPIPVFLILAQPDNPTFRWWALVATLVIAATDMLDGYLARRWNQITELGQIIDPLADKALVISVVFALCWTNILVAPWGWIFLGLNLLRESGVAAVRYWHRKSQAQLIIPANKDGKRKMIYQAAGIALAIMPIPLWGWQLAIWVPLTASLVYSARSGWAYLWAK